MRWFLTHETKTWKVPARWDELGSDPALALMLGKEFPWIGFFFLIFFAISWAAPAAYGGSQARGLIGAVAASLRQSHSNAGSEPCLRPTPQLTQHRIVNPLSKARDQTRNLMVPSQIR